MGRTQHYHFFLRTLFQIWAALGTAIVSIIGILFFGEPVSKEKVICLTMILIGVVGLELLDEH